MRDEHVRQTRDLLETEQFRVRQEAVLPVEHLLGHAVGAAEVATVGDRNTQITQRALQPISDVAQRRTDLRGRGQRHAAHAGVEQRHEAFGHLVRLTRQCR